MNVQSVADIDHFPSWSRVVRRAATDLEGDKHKTLAAELSKEVWLDSSDKPVVVPVK